MSVVEAVSPSVSPVATVSPTVTPSASPIAHAVAVHGPSLVDQINTWAAHVSTTDLIVAAGIIAVILQALINMNKRFQKIEDDTQATINQIISLLMPYIVLIPAGLVNGFHNLKYAPIIFVTAKIVYYIGQKLRKPAPVTEVAI